VRPPALPARGAGEERPTPHGPLRLSGRTAAPEADGTASVTAGFSAMGLVVDMRTQPSPGNLWRQEVMEPRPVEAGSRDLKRPRTCVVECLRGMLVPLFQNIDSRG